MPYRFERWPRTNNPLLARAGARWGPIPAVTALLALALPGALAAQNDDLDAGDAGILGPIIVDSSRLERDWLGMPAALGVVGTEDAQQGRQHLQLDEPLARIPGVFMQNRHNFAQDLRVSIRGFGARSAFGIRGIKLIVDGIPETVVDGQSQVDAVDLTSVQQIEVIRGPSSALYGNATGGVIDVETFGAPIEPLRRLRLDAGSFGYRRQSVQAGTQYRDWGYFLSAYNLDYDGFREHNKADKKLFNGKFNMRVGTSATLEAVVRVLDAPDTLDPGALTRAEADAGRRQARQRNVDLGSRQSASQQTLGLVYRDVLPAGDDFTARLFYTNRDFIQFLPFEAGGVVTYDRTFVGGGLQRTRHGTLAGRGNRLTTGVDVEFQQDDRQRFDNDAGQKGALAFDQLERAHSIGVFAQNLLALTDRLSLTAGLRYDNIGFEIEDRHTPGAEPDDSGERNFSEFSGTLGASYVFAADQSGYATVGTAFETPTFTEFAVPDGAGGFNPEVEPQKAINYEIGAKGSAGPHLRYDIALFRVEVRDELVPFESVAGRTFFENSGRSERQGVEVQVSYAIGDSLTATGALTYSDFEFERFVDDGGNDFAGKRIPGIPESHFFGELAYRPSDTGFAILDFQVYDELYADNANEVKVAGYTVVNARFGLERRLWQRPLALYVGVNNLLDEEYFSNVRINAFGGRYFEPAPDRNYYLGVKLEL